MLKHEPHRRQHHRHHHRGQQCCGEHSSHDNNGSKKQGLEEDFDDILAETHPCCEKDKHLRARAQELRAKLNKVDPSQVAERARKAAFSLTETQIPCQGEGVDYPALRAARQAALEGAQTGDANGDRRNSHNAGRNDPSSEGTDSEADDDGDDDSLDDLLDDPELLRIEEARVRAMQADAARLERLRSLGFGVHLEVPESEVEAIVQGQFRGAGVVLHAYDPDSLLCASLDLHLEKKAASFTGTRFVRCRLRPGSEVASRMRLKGAPCLSCYKGGARVAYTDGMSQFGNDGADPGAVDRWLTASGTLDFDPPHLAAFEEGGGFGRTSRTAGGENGGVGDAAEDADWFDCGLKGCHKSFKHNHFLREGGGGLPEDFDQPF